MKPLTLAILAGYFGAVGYLIGKRDIDVKLMNVIRNAQDEYTRRQFRIMTDEAKRLKAVNVG